MEGLGPDLLLKGLAGAVIARMSSIPIAIGASLGIGVIEQILLSNPDTRDLVTVVIALIIVVALLRQPQLGRSGQDKGSWRRVVLPPLPEAYRAIRSIRWFPRVSVVIGIAVAVGLAYVVSNDTASVLTLVAGYTLVGLSVGLLTGLSGQLSLGQFAYAGIAAAASAHVADSTEQLPLRRALRRDRGGARLRAGRHPGDAAQGPRARGLDAGLRARDLDLAAAPGLLPRRRHLAGQADLVGLPARRTPSTTTSSRSWCSASACG